MGALEGMQLVFHGGKCCGIKTVYRMGSTPTESQPALQKLSRRNNRDQNYGEVSSDMRFFTDEAPEEDGKSRLIRYIDFMKHWRPSNILEVVLCKSQYDWQDQSDWIPVLAELGFRQVNKHYNSNSGNDVLVWHLNVGEDLSKDEATEAAEEADEEASYDD